MVVLIASLLALIVLIVLFFLVRQAISTVGGLPLNAEWIDELSAERYRPMMRLLDDRDLGFLRTQPGFSPRIASRLRRQRIQIFRGYLRCLTADFRRVCTAVKILMQHSQHDRPDLASALVHSQISFALGIATVETRLFFYRWGLGGVDVNALVKTFDIMRLELRTLVPSAVAAGA